MPHHAKISDCMETKDKFDGHVSDVESQSRRVDTEKSVSIRDKSHASEPNRTSTSVSEMPQLSEKEENQLKETVGKLSFQLTKQKEKYEKMKQLTSEKDVQMRNLEADIEAKNSRIQLLIAQHAEVLELSHGHAGPEVDSLRDVGKAKQSSVVPESVAGVIGSTIQCPGCVKEYKLSSDLTLVDVSEENSMKEQASLGEKSKASMLSLEPFITDPSDVEYFKHELMSGLTKDIRKRAKALSIPIKTTDKKYKLKKDLQNEIFLVSTGKLLYPSRPPPGLVHSDSELSDGDSDRQEEGEESPPQVSTNDNKDATGKASYTAPSGSDEVPTSPPRRRIVFYRQKLELKAALQNESIDEIRERAESLNIDIFDESGKFKPKKKLKEEIYGEMTGDGFYQDIHAMTRMDSRVLK